MLNEEVGSESGQPMASLERALRTEVALLEALARGLIDQRNAIAADDTAGLEQLVQQLSRTLLTLREARRQRRVLTEMVTGDAEATLGALMSSLPPDASPLVGQLCRELRDRAHGANRELTINQTVIRRAIQSGERFLQQLLTAPNLEGYREQKSPDLPGGLLLNERA